MFSSNLSSSKTRQITQASSPPFCIAQKILFVCPAVEITCGLGVGAGAKTSDTTLLFLVYSTAEYWSLVCSRSTCFIHCVLNDALRVVTECLDISQRTTYQFFQTSSHLSFTTRSDSCFG